jgi:hypothetical protein
MITKQLSYAHSKHANIKFQGTKIATIMITEFSSLLLPANSTAFYKVNAFKQTKSERNIIEM